MHRRRKLSNVCIFASISIDKSQPYVNEEKTQNKILILQGVWGRGSSYPYQSFEGWDGSGVGGLDK